MLFHILKCLCSSNIARKWGTPYLWCKSLWCVYKCYFQISFPLSNFSSCLCSTILCFLHFNHLGSQRLMFVFMSLSYESTWGHCFQHQVLLQIHWLLCVCVKSHTIGSILFYLKKDQTKIISYISLLIFNPLLHLESWIF